MSPSPPSPSWSQLFQHHFPQEQRCGVGPRGSRGSVTPLSLLQRRTGTSPTRPPCHRPLALAAGDVLGHPSATVTPGGALPSEGVAGEVAALVRHTRCPGGTVRTTLLEVPSLRWGFLARGVGVFSASEDKPQPICTVRSQQEL